jgi:hypothetical protein
MARTLSRRLSKQQVVLVYEELKKRVEKIDDEYCRYISEHDSDERVAEDMGYTLGQIMHTRREFFGNTRVPPARQAKAEKCDTTRDEWMADLFTLVLKLYERLGEPIPKLNYDSVDHLRAEWVKNLPRE